MAQRDQTGGMCLAGKLIKSNHLSGLNKKLHRNASAGCTCTPLTEPCPGARGEAEAAAVQEVLAGVYQSNNELNLE